MNVCIWMTLKLNFSTKYYTLQCRNTNLKKPSPISIFQWQWKQNPETINKKIKIRTCSFDPIRWLNTVHVYADQLIREAAHTCNCKAHYNGNSLKAKSKKRLALETGYAYHLTRITTIRCSNITNSWDYVSIYDYLDLNEINVLKNTIEAASIKCLFIKYYNNIKTPTLLLEKANEFIPPPITMIQTETETKKKKMSENPRQS